MTNVKYQFEKYKYNDFFVHTYYLHKNKRTFVPLHFHNEIEFLFIASGKTEIVAGNNTYICNEGDMVIIDPLVQHSFKKHTKDAEIKGLVFDLKVVESILSTYGYSHCFDNLKSVLILNKKKINTFLINEISIIDELIKKENLNRLEIIGHITLIIAELANIGLIFEDEILDSQSRIAQAIDYINSNYSNKIYVSDLSSLVNMSVNNFIRIFKKTTSKTPTQYINNFRIRKAIQMLTTTDFTIEKISEETGFNSVQYFTKTFKNTLGLSPTDYRKVNNINKEMIID